MRFIKLSTKNPKIILPILIAMYLAIFTEAELDIASISINQLGLPNAANCFFCAYLSISILITLFSGILAEIFGRKSTLLIGFFFFTLASFGCLFETYPNLFIFCKFIQRAIGSLPLVLGVVLLIEQYQFRKSSAYIGIFNFFIGLGAIMATLSHIFPEYLHWHGSPLVIFLLSLISLIGIVFFVEQDIHNPKEKKTFISVAKNYLPILRNLSFLGNSILSIFPLVAMTIFSQQFPNLLLDHFRLSSSEYFFYQLSNELSFAFFSMLSYVLVSKKGIDFTKGIGFILLSIGILTILSAALMNITHIPLICSSMSFFIAGGALMTGTFGIKAIQQYPAHLSLAGSILFLLRQLMIAGITLFYNHHVITSLTSLILPWFLLWSLILFWFLKIERIGRANIYPEAANQ